MLRHNHVCEQLALAFSSSSLLFSAFSLGFSQNCFLTDLLCCSSPALPVCLSVCLQVFLSLLSLSVSVCVCACPLMRATSWYVFVLLWWVWSAWRWAWSGRRVRRSLVTFCYGYCMQCSGSGGRLSLSERDVTVWAAPSLCHVQTEPLCHFLLPVSYLMVKETPKDIILCLCVLQTRPLWLEHTPLTLLNCVLSLQRQGSVKSIENALEKETCFCTNFYLLSP